MAAQQKHLMEEEAPIDTSYHSHVSMLQMDTKEDQM